MATILDNVSLRAILSLFSDNLSSVTLANAVLGANNSTDQTRPYQNVRGLILFLKTTGGASTFKIQFKNQLTGLYYDALISGSVSSTSAVVIFSPGSATPGNISKIWRVLWTTDSGAPTNTVVAEYVY